MQSVKKCPKCDVPMEIETDAYGEFAFTYCEICEGSMNPFENLDTKEEDKK